MNIDNSAGVGCQHLLLQHPHETSQDHNLHFGLLQHLDQLRFDPWLEPRPKMPGREVGVRHPELARDLENRRIQYIGNYDGRFRV